MLVAHGLVAAPPGALPVFSPLDLTLHRGEWVALEGPNGAGKSTLFAALAGLLEPLAGDVTLDDAPLTLESPARARVAILFQEPEAHFLTPRADTEIAFPLESLGWPRSAIEERVRALAARLDLTGLLARELETLSGGERARVALAVALAAKPQFLLLDEPGNYLDTVQRARLREWVRDEVARGAGVLWATQLEEEAEAASRRLRLAGGRLQEAHASPTGGARLASQDREETSIRLPGAGRVLLRASGVVCSVGRGTSRRSLLMGVDLCVCEGELLLVEGESGCGKTTALALLSGLLEPDSGGLSVEAPAGEGHESGANDFGILLQSPEDQLVGATVFDDLALGRGAEGSGRDKARIRSALELVGLDADRASASPPGSLSHGERRRVAWAGLLLLDARIWILDEPTAGVDDAGVGILLSLIEGHLRAGGAAIVAHQDPRLRRRLGRVLRIRRGRLEPENIGQGSAP